ncbi:MAG: ATP-binding protein [Chromatiales bacterium]|jgi:signal transduction histidine kinase/CheY-like chemotaxis protein/purine-cytosine permease-like protein
MPSEPQINSAHRTYNKWVANETLEDFALRFTAKRARRWSVGRIANTALGTASFLVLEALGGGITLAYGFDNSFYAILSVCAILFLTGLPIAYYAAKYGVDIDLLTRGAGFGYIGSTISSLIYASFTFIFFALEAAIMSMAIHLLIGIPLPIAYIISAIVIIPLVTHGITMISRFQIWTQPFWVILQLLPFVYIVQHEAVDLQAWVNFGGAEHPEQQGFNLLLFGSAAAILFPLIAQIGEQVDFLRFLPQKSADNRRGWWMALVSSGPGWVLPGFLKLLAGSLLAYIAFAQGVDASLASDPTHMYQVAFNFVTGSPWVALVIASVFVILCQLKINVANAYAGSLAWSNFFSRLTHYHPGRVVWVVFNVSIALILMELGIYEALESVLQTYSAFVLAWMGALVADLVINKPLGLSPRHIEFRRSHLYDINPVGFGSMMLASVTGIASHFGVFGQLAQALSPFIALFLPFLLAPLFAWLTRSRFYLARPHETPEHQAGECTICQNQFDSEDMTTCPAFAGASICSLCCSLESQCADRCRQHATLPAQGFAILQWLFPQLKHSRPNPALTRFLISLSLATFVLLGILTLIYLQTPYDSLVEQALSADILFKVFFLLLILLGIFTWLYVLSQESRKHALQESQQQTQLLEQEIAAHETTYRYLQEAKETAETANQAKSRYLAGISHELRTPLNVILGYAQILENSDDIPGKHKDSLNLVRQNGEHLADLIEGLLEISKIEAGRLELQKDEVRLPVLLDQLADMFRLQANNKGLEFNYTRSEHLPEFISIDQKRLRQLLINLLSNAVKYTTRGEVNFTVQYRHQIAKFIISDTGDGIATEDQQRIFEPFERIRSATNLVTGTGLGLAIARLLAELMGGDITVTSAPGQGSIFTLTLALSQINKHTTTGQSQYRQIIGYHGERKNIVVVDDEYQHRQLLKEFLGALDFNIHSLDSAESCLEFVQGDSDIDLFILDVSMPGLSGLQLCEKLRQDNNRKPVIMLSANTRNIQHDNYTSCYQAYLSKPVQFNQLLDQIGDNLSLDWLYANDQAMPERSDANGDKPLAVSVQTLKELKSLAEIGFLSALKEKLSTIEQQKAMPPELLKKLNAQVASCNFPALIKSLDDINNHE